MKKLIWALLFPLFVIGCSADDEDQSWLADYAPIVTTTIIKPQIVQISEEYPARVKAFRQAEVRAQVGGILEKRLFTEGSLVEKGDFLFQIDDAPFQVALKEAKASLDRAEAEAIRTHLQVERQKKLLATKATTAQQYEEAESAYKSALADIAAATSQIERAELDLQYARIAAPISGKIGQSYQSEGALVFANDSQVLAVIQQVDKVYIDVKQPFSQVEYLESIHEGLNILRYPNAKVEIFNGDGKAYDLPAKHLFTELDVSETMGDSLIRVEVENLHNKLRPGMYVRVKMTFGEISEGLLIPVQSVTRNAGGKPQVMVINSDDLGEYRDVVLGQQIGSYYLVKSGISSGEQIAVEGFTRAAENSPITVKKWNPNLEEKYGLNDEIQAQLDEIMQLIQVEIGG